MTIATKAEAEWIERTYGSRWMSTPSPQKYQIWRMECVHCDFAIEPSRFRHYSDSRPDHPQPYGNFASLSHARKLMREHVCKTSKALTPSNSAKETT